LNYDVRASSSGTLTQLIRADLDLNLHDPSGGDRGLGHLFRLFLALPDGDHIADAVAVME
jgi:hypothetical protein